jgi:OFA family oxalate/formate antiporter-like MFS transporter
MVFFVDRFGPKGTLMVGGSMVLAGWVMMGRVDCLFALYVLYTLAGAGVGIVYGVAMNTENRWLNDFVFFCLNCKESLQVPLQSHQEIA